HHARRGLVEGAVPRAALGGLNAGGASLLAGAAREQLARGPEEILDPPVDARREADPSGVAVVDEDRRRPELWVRGVGDAADVRAVAEREEREEGDHRVLGGVQA